MGVTSMVTMQLVFAARVTPLRPTLVPPAVALTVPPQVLLTTRGVALKRLAGYGSAKCRFVRAMLFGFEIVMARWDTAFVAIVAGVKVFEAVTELKTSSCDVAPTALVPPLKEMPVLAIVFV